MLQLSISVTVDECKSTFTGDSNVSKDVARSLAIECLQNLLEVNEFKSANNAADLIEGEDAA